MSDAELKGLVPGGNQALGMVYPETVQSPEDTPQTHPRFLISELSFGLWKPRIDLKSRWPSVPDARDSIKMQPACSEFQKTLPPIKTVVGPGRDGGTKREI